MTESETEIEEIIKELTKENLNFRYHIEIVRKVCGESRHANSPESMLAQAIMRILNGC